MVVTQCLRFSWLCRRDIRFECGHNTLPSFTVWSGFPTRYRNKFLQTIIWRSFRSVTGSQLIIMKALLAAIRWLPLKKQSSVEGSQFNIHQKRVRVFYERSLRTAFPRSVLFQMDSYSTIQREFELSHTHTHTHTHTHRIFHHSVSYDARFGHIMHSSAGESCEAGHINQYKRYILKMLDII